MNLIFAKILDFLVIYMVKHKNSYLSSRFLILSLGLICTFI